jgi:hypothetical protein
VEEAANVHLRVALPLRTIAAKQLLQVAARGLSTAAAAALPCNRVTKKLFPQLSIATTAKQIAA